MRVAKEERIRKETALEALESALKQRGRQRRPRRGTTGWKAIEQAICWWKGNDSWLDLPRDIQDIDLRTATAWRTYRQKGVGVMSKDVDLELLAVWTEALYYMIGDDKFDETSTTCERIEDGESGSNTKQSSVSNSSSVKHQRRHDASYSSSKKRSKFVQLELKPSTFEEEYKGSEEDCGGGGRCGGLEVLAASISNAKRATAPSAIVS